MGELLYKSASEVLGIKNNPSVYAPIGSYKDLLPYLPHNKKHKELLLMGGAYGHLSHPFDDKDMTFGNMKELVDLALQGKLEYVREKTDGQNIMVTWERW